MEYGACCSEINLKIRYRLFLFYFEMYYVNSSNILTVNMDVVILNLCAFLKVKCSLGVLFHKPICVCCISASFPFPFLFRTTL